MAHVTFIHGICNKVAPDKLLANWRDELADGGIDLGAEGDEVTVLQDAGVDRLGVDEGHVGAVLVGEPKSLVFELDLGVVA